MKSGDKPKKELTIYNFLTRSHQIFLAFLCFVFQWYTAGTNLLVTLNMKLFLSFGRRGGVGGGVYGLSEWSRLASKAIITGGFRLGRSHRARSQGHNNYYTIDRLEKKGVKGEALDRIR